MSKLSDSKIAFLGTGAIAAAMIERLLASGTCQSENLFATDPLQESLVRAKDRFRINTSTANRDGVRFGDIVFLAMPPDKVTSVLREIALDLKESHLLISLAAAVSLTDLQAAVGRPLPIVRVIPNTPSMVGAGVNPYCRGSHVRPEAELLHEILDVLGAAVEIDEDLMNAATALTAVGPTYVFPMIRALAEAAEAHGLSHDIALRAAAEVVAGSARLVVETGREPDDLKMMIGLRTLDEAQARDLFTTAFVAAFEKLSGLQKKLAA